MMNCKRSLLSLISVVLLGPQAIRGFDLTPHAPLIDSNFLSTVVSPLVSSYQQALHANPLQTQVATGVVLAVAGDAAAQQKNDEYDIKRAASFATFDGVYRATQHFIYPPMIAACQGHVLGSIFSSEGVGAAVEQALVSQLLIIPVVYYPVFFAVTGAVQGLSTRQTINRATSSFWPLMTRNWLFWIPIQFGVFVGVPDESAQISILIACGLVWTVILSALAGDVQVEPPVLTPVGEAKAEAPVPYKPNGEILGSE
jgi:hypothetical protein